MMTVCCGCRIVLVVALRADCVYCLRHRAAPGIVSEKPAQVYEHTASAAKALRPPRIPAQKTPLGELAVWLLVRGALRRMFARVRVAGGDAIRDAAGLPLLGVANHPSWWDGYCALALARWYGRPRYLMMDEPQLRRYRFFAWAGCFSVDRHDPRESARSVAYAAHLLATERAPLVWLFPQAEIVPPSARPITVHPGAAHILRRATVVRETVGVLPVAWEPVFRGEQHPEVFIRVLPVLTFDRRDGRDIEATTMLLQAMLTAAADRLRHDLQVETLGDYQVIVHGRGGVNDVFDRLLRRPRLVADE